MLSEFQHIFWLILVGFVLVRYILALTDTTGYFKNKFVNEQEDKEFKDARNHSMILASFTIVALSIAIAENSNKPNIASLYFLSLPMLVFFVSTLLFELKTNKWIPHTGDVLQKVGIISIAIGFLYLISGLFTDFVLNALYVGFFIGIMAYAIIDLLNNYQYFHPKQIGKA